MSVISKNEAMMLGVDALVKDGRASDLDCFDGTSELFEVIGFPEDAAAFLGEWYPETWCYAYDRWRYGTYDWATVGVFESVDEVLALYPEMSRDEIEEHGFIIEDAAFEGVIALISD